MRTTAAVLAALAAIAILAYRLATFGWPVPPDHSPPSAERTSSSTAASSGERPAAPAKSPDETASAPPTPGEHGAEDIKRTLVAVMGASRKAAANRLVEQGLAPEDS